ncbi:hypothetical protein ACLIMP_05725 [Novosphingobium aerophilum]|nr:MULTISPECIES: hypothetical protein [unclassified Novosphingobium]TCM37303.1 hypothetical protein EDF59_11111 [Novosphingobium sp. ST904]WRT93736.1 hypothetical protein U9J33_04270 [Novosphingobium sp. RL4]
MTIALAGASGSHPETLKLLAREVREMAPSMALTVFDMSAFDLRGTARYEDAEGEVIKPTPRDVGIRAWFKTAGPNVAVSGGTRAFARMQRYFESELTRRGTRVLLLSHCWGFPEQALLKAAAALGIRIAMIDEGPFSLPLNGRERAEARRGLRGTLARILHQAGLVPRRDLTGQDFDRLFITAQGRADELVRRGVDADKIRVVGSPRFDRIAATARARQEHRDTAAKPIRVLWLHQPFRSDGKVSRQEVDRAETMLAQGLAAFSRGRDLVVGLRLHPRTEQAERERMARLMAEHGIASEMAEGPLYDHFIDCDSVVGFYSSALLEAAACAIPVIVARLAPTAFAQQGEAAKALAMTEVGFAVADQPDDVVTALTAHLEGDDRVDVEALIRAELGPLEGTGTATVARWLIEQQAQPAGEASARS